MPIFSYFAIVGAVLVALFFLADATLEKGTPPVVTSERQGLPEPWRPDPIQTLVAAPAPEPDMTSQAVLAAQPKSPAEVLIPPKKNRVPRKQLPDDHYRQSQAWSRDRDRGPFGGDRILLLWPILNFSQSRFSSSPFCSGLFQLDDFAMHSARTDEMIC